MFPNRSLWDIGSHWVITFFSDPSASFLGAEAMQKAAAVKKPREEEEEVESDEESDEYDVVRSLFIFICDGAHISR